MDQPIDKLVERYEQIIENLEAKIFDLEGKVEKLSLWADVKAWSRHREQEDYLKALPAPRLQIEFTRLDKWKTTAFYALAYPFFDEVHLVPMGETSVGKSFEKLTMPTTNEEALKMLPYRDGVHIRRDSKSLNLPAFLIFNQESFRLDFSEEI